MSICLSHPLLTFSQQLPAIRTEYTIFILPPSLLNHQPWLPPPSFIPRHFFAISQAPMTQNHWFLSVSCFFTSALWHMLLCQPGIFPIPFFTGINFLTLEFRAVGRCLNQQPELGARAMGSHSLLCPSSLLSVLMHNMHLCIIFPHNFLNYEIFKAPGSFIPPNLSQCVAHST